MQENFNNIKKLNEILINIDNSTTTTEKLITFINTLKVACFLRFSNRNKPKSKIEKMEDGRFLLSYTIKNNTYNMIIPRMINKVSPILYVYDENNNNITDEFEKYLGPNLNFHGFNYTPKLLGYKSITIVYDNNKIQKFIENEFICVYI